MRTAKTDQTGRMPRLIWVFAGHTLILLVWSCRGSYILGNEGFMALLRLLSHLEQSKLMWLMKWEPVHLTENQPVSEDLLFTKRNLDGNLGNIFHFSIKTGYSLEWPHQSICFCGDLLKIILIIINYPLVWAELYFSFSHTLASSRLQPEPVSGEDSSDKGFIAFYQKWKPPGIEKTAQTLLLQVSWFNLHANCLRRKYFISLWLICPYLCHHQQFTCISANNKFLQPSLN